MATQRACRLWGSRPVVGSSRKRTGGLATSAAARSRRRRMPPEYVLSTRSPAPVSPNSSSSSSARRADSLAAQVGQAPHHVDVLPAREVLVHRGVLAGQPDGAADGIGLLDDVVAEDGRRGPSRGRGWWRGCARRSSCRRRSARAARGPCPAPPRARPRRGPARGRGGRPSRGRGPRRPGNGRRNYVIVERNLVIKLLTCQDNGRAPSSPSSCAARSWGTWAPPVTSTRAWPRS